MKVRDTTTVLPSHATACGARRLRGPGDGLLAPGARWLFENQVIEINGLVTSGMASIRFEATGEVMDVSIASLRPLPLPPGAGSISAIPSAEWSRAKKLAEAIAPLAAMPTVPSVLLASVAEAQSLCVRQLQRLITRFRMDPRCSALVRRKRGRPLRSRMLHSDVERIISHVIRKRYLVREPLSKPDVVARVQSICRRTRLPVPSAGAVYRRLEDCQSYQGDVKRLGAKQARQRWESRPGQLQVAAALDFVQIDHTLVDILVLSDERTEVLGRPWITIAFDVATRVVLGFYLSMDAPSGVGLSLCIAHAVLPKIEDARDPGIWPMYGRMKVIHVDNGGDLVSAAMHRGCEQYCIELLVRPLGKAYYGGHIERMMGTLMRLIHGLPGTTFSNVQQRGDYPSEARATMTLSELHAWVTQKIGRYYHVRVHRSLGVPPLVAWERAWRDPDGRVIAPPMVPHPDEFRVDFLPYVTRRLQRTGVEFRRTRYWSEALRCQVRPGRFVQVHYDPREPSRAWVRLEDDVVIPADAVTGPGAGQCRQAKIDPDTRQRLNEALDRGFVETDRIEHMAASAKRAMQRKRGRKPRRVERSRNQSADWRQDGMEFDIPLDQSRVNVMRADE